MVWSIGGEERDKHATYRRALFESPPFRVDHGMPHHITWFRGGRRRSEHHLPRRADGVRALSAAVLYQHQRTPGGHQTPHHRCGSSPVDEKQRVTTGMKLSGNATTNHSTNEFSQVSGRRIKFCSQKRNLQPGPSPRSFASHQPQTTPETI